MHRAVFLDRDGTLNHDPGYLNHPDQLKLLPRVGEALAHLNRAGFKLVVISNQSGVGRGLIKPEMLSLIHRRMDELLAPFGAVIDHYELCVHRPDENCECRKPKPGMIHRAAVQLGIDVARSYMVGDKRIDMGAGRAAGCRAVALVRTGYGEGSEEELAAGSPERPDFVGDSLFEVAEWITETAIPG